MVFGFQPTVASTRRVWSFDPDANNLCDPDTKNLSLSELLRQERAKEGKPNADTPLEVLAQQQLEYQFGLATLEQHRGLAPYQL